MDEFREFVKGHQLVREEVKSGKRTWQQIYEDWYIMGDGDEIWGSYKNKTQPQSGETKKLEDLLNSDNIKNIWEHVKKINPDSISKTLNTVQKVLQITQSFGGRNVSSLYNANYNSWWD